ncbi:MAG: hypothetical protein M3Y82_10420 [Verrucomicrobiota bacterium]|nr:hypothetical protein [Verrucomicrobiota bacterium]
MSNLLIGLLSALVATNQPAAVSNLVKRTTGASVEVANPNDPVEKEYLKLLAADDAAREEVDKWIRQAQAFEEKGAGAPQATLNLRIKERFTSVTKSYEDFLEKHPNHTRARLAYGSFLSETGDEFGGMTQWEKARELDPKNPAAWNNLANYYGHRSPVKKSFEYYAKAIELNPNEPVYYQNFATTVYLFRKDAMEFYNLNETEVFDKALDLYRKAMKLDPDNFILATDYAESFYGTKPPRYQEGLTAWNQALKIAHDEVEREGIYLHLARIKINLRQFESARTNLNAVTNEKYSALKTTLAKKLAKEEEKAKSTNAPSVAIEK